MTRFLLTTSLLLSLSATLCAQQWEWINRAGSSNVADPGIDYSYSVRTDNIGNVYVLYWFNYPQNQDTIDTHFTGYPSVNPYIVGQTHVAKYRSDGQLIWAKNLFSFIREYQGATDYVHPYCMEIDSMGHIYIGGTMNVDSMYFNGDTISNVNSSSSGFVVKCDTALNQQWLFFTNTYAGGNGCTIYDLALDQQGRLYAAGNVVGNTIFGNDTLFEPPSQSTSFIMRFDNNANPDWLTTYHSPGSLANPSLTIAQSGDIIVGNDFSTSIFYGTDTATLAGSHSAILRLDSSLNFISWQINAQMYLRDLLVRDSTIYFCGRYYGTIVLPVGTFTGNSLDAYVCSKSIDGTYNWFGTLGIPGSDDCDNIALQSDGSIIAGGDFRQAFMWNSCTFTPASQHEDVLIVKFDSTGVVRWIATGGGYGFDYLYDLTADPWDNIYITGKVGSPNNVFGNLTVPVLAGGDAFVTSINGFPCANGCQISVIGPDTVMCRGDSILFTAPSGFTNVFWSNGDTGDSIWWNTEGSVAFYAVDSAGCYRESDAAFVDIRPDADITGGAGHYCRGDSVILRPFNPQLYQSFLWSEGSTDDTAYIVSDGQYWLTVTDTNGCIGNSDTVNVLFSEPTAFFTDSSFCAGFPTYFFDSSYCNIPGEWINWWRWDFYPGSSLAQNATNTYASTGTYTVQLRVRTNYYCYDTLITSVTIDPPAPVAGIVISNDTLFSVYSSGNQWLLDGQIIPGANDSFYVFTQNGDYSVVTTNTCGFDTSAIVIIDVGFTTLGVEESIDILPNPAADHIVIRSSTINPDPVMLRVYDINGRLLQEEKVMGPLLNSGYQLRFDFSETGLMILQVDGYNLRFVRYN